MSKRICIKVYDDEISINESITNVEFNLLDNEDRVIEMYLNNDDSSKVDIRVKNNQIEEKSIYDLKEENFNFWDKVLNM